VLLDLLLGVVDVLVSFVLKVNDAFGGLIGLLSCLSLLDHAVNVRVGKTTAGADSDLLLLASRLVLGGNVHDTVGIDIEGDLDLGNTTGSHGDSLEFEISKFLVVLGELALTLENSDADLGLVVSGGGENLALLGWDGCVSSDKSGEDATHGLNTERQRSNVEEEDIFDVAGEDSTLNSGTNSDSLVGVHTSVGSLVEEALHGLTDLGDSARATNHEHFVDLVLSKTRVLKASLEWLQGLVDIGLDETLEFSTSHLHVQMLGTTVIECEIGDADSGVGRG